MARVTKEQINAIILGKEDTYPRDLFIWAGTLGAVGTPPFYLNHEQKQWFDSMILRERRKLQARQRRHYTMR